MTELEQSPQAAFNVVTWNILLDYTRAKEGVIAAQKDRLESQIGTLGSLGVDLDVVCLQEVQANNGQHIARSLGHDPGDWYNHNTSKRKGEYIGMFGERVEQTTYIDLPHDKRAVVTNIGKTAIVGIHNRCEVVGSKRQDQMKSVLTALEDEEHAIIMGDANDIPLGHSRRLLGLAGFESVFTSAGKRNPMTHPTDAYRDAFHNLYQRRLAPKGTSLDIIYARNMQVVDTGRFEGDSDHFGLWATVAPKE